MPATETIITAAASFGAALGGAGLGAWLAHRIHRRQQHREQLRFHAHQARETAAEWSDLLLRLLRSGSLDPRLDLETDAHAAGYRLGSALSSITAIRPDWVRIDRLREEIDTSRLVTAILQGRSSALPAHISAVTATAALAAEATDGDVSALAALRDRHWVSPVVGGVGATNWIEGDGSAEEEEEILIELETLG